MNEERNPKARKNLGHTEQIMVKLHPVLKAHVDAAAEAGYCTTSEYIRQLIVADKRRADAEAAR